MTLLAGQTVLVTGGNRGIGREYMARCSTAECPRCTPPHATHRRLTRADQGVMTTCNDSASVSRFATVATR